MIDMVSAVEELSRLTTKELNEMLRESDTFVLQSEAEDGGPKQVDMEKLVSSLPLHLLAVCLELGEGSDLTYVLRAMRFLHSLSELANRHTRLEQVLLDDVKLSEQVMDLIFFLLTILAQRKKENRVGAAPLVHASLVAASLHLLTSYFSSQWHELVHILLAHPKVEIFMDVAFDSLHEDCEASLQFLLLLSQQKLFRDRILRNKELSRNGGILSLSRAILKLTVPECLKDSADIVASISRLKAKILSILLQLCEAESVSYLDEVATSPNSMQLGHTLALEVLDLLKTAFGKKQKLNSDSHDKSYPMGTVLISALRLVDVFSDDSNFRSSFMTNTVPFLTQILAIPHDEFVSSWCSVNLAAIEEDANLEYDPFSAAEVALLASDDMLSEAKANYSCHFRSLSMPSIAYAQTRTSCVVKIIANLHVFVPNICEEQERDLFLLKFQNYVASEGPKPLVDQQASADVKATTVCRNLGSLSDYAKSLIPNLLNEEDVQLLSDFSEKLQLWCKSQVGHGTIQAVQNVTSSQIKEDLHPVQQPLPTQASALDSSIDRLPKVEQSIEASTPTPLIKQEAIPKDETPRNVQEDDKGDASMYDERQPKRRKRTLMNDEQINEIEKALVDEPEMHKNTPLLQAWSEKLSLQGSEVTPSQLKNWLNNRKAKLARIAKEKGVPYEGEIADKPSTPATPHLGESSESASEDSYLPPARVMTALGISKGSRLVSPDSVGRGKISQVEGGAQGRSLVDSRVCIVDVTELKIEKWRELPHPSEASGRTFQEAESKNGGVMRVTWDVSRLSPVVYRDPIIYTSPPHRVHDGWRWRNEAARKLAHTVSTVAGCFD
ncbi:hypothetical protein QOZ80_9BG0717470 [Eleusine coracana subsp. coracana]|nr:hypothetical protein QOZ80_9BG0717470 [Eleusine coracana subsp. coracana]